MLECDELVREGEQRFAKPMERAAVRDGRLSWGARGLFFFLWDLPYNWHPRISHLVQMGPENKDAVRARIAELERVAAMRIEPIRQPDGRVKGKRWVIRAASLWAEEWPLDGAGKTEDRKSRPSVNPRIGISEAKVHQYQGSPIQGSPIKTTTTDFTLEELMEATEAELAAAGKKMGAGLKDLLTRRFLAKSCNFRDSAAVELLRKAREGAAHHAALLAEDPEPNIPRVTAEDVFAGAWKRTADGQS